MKTTLVRVAVVTIALVGFGASSISAKVAASTGHKSVIVSSSPTPLCGPWNGTTCGMQ